MVIIKLFPDVLHELLLFLLFIFDPFVYNISKVMVIHTIFRVLKLFEICTLFFGQGLQVLVLVLRITKNVIKSAAALFMPKLIVQKSNLSLEDADLLLVALKGMIDRLI